MKKANCTVKISKIDELTQAVILFKKNPTHKLFKQIQKDTSKLIGYTFKYYDILKYFPPVVLEDIKDQCEVEVLYKYIQSFNSTRGVKFSTHYVWGLKSRIACSRDTVMRRINLLQTTSIERVLSTHLV